MLFRSARATLEASSINGGINLDKDLPVQTSEMSRQRMAGTLNGGGPRIVATTVNGGVRIGARGRQDDGNQAGADRPGT